MLTENALQSYLLSLFSSFVFMLILVYIRTIVLYFFFPNFFPLFFFESSFHPPSIQSFSSFEKGEKKKNIFWKIYNHRFYMLIQTRKSSRVCLFCIFIRVFSPPSKLYFLWPHPLFFCLLEQRWPVYIIEILSIIKVDDWERSKQLFKKESIPIYFFFLKNKQCPSKKYFLPVVWRWQNQQ